ncbi:MAG TPA: sigma-70 family RNA polymerase sigma factor [Pyrinomonadaceae bacterium]|nr:sigma-70 family RNA polymerase sigma factor [Pyrinomonadaceae bacterium]
MPDTVDTDEDLLRRARAGEEDAFLSIYTRHRVAMYRFACRLLRSESAAEDVTHDCFLSLFKHPERFDPARGTSLRTYLFAAVHNLSMKHFRRAGQEAWTDEATAREPQTPDAEEPLSRLIEAELSATVRAAVEQLPALQREVLILFEFEELSLSEIAVVLDAEVNTVKSRLQRARAGLRRTLAPYLERREELDKVLVGAAEK